MTMKIQAESQTGIDLAEYRFQASRSGLERRKRGVTFTPQWIVDLMIGALRSTTTQKVLIIDAGAGAGRFTLAAASSVRSARVLAVESDSMLAKILNQQVAESDLGNRVQIMNQNFLHYSLPKNPGRMIFIGNPPYVRHHSIPASDKAFLRRLSESFGVNFSGLSGLHVYFMLRCLSEAREGDRLLMILPSEWLEARYGDAVKQVILEHCSSTKFYIFPEKVKIFGETMTTSLILDLTVGLPSHEVSVAIVKEGTRELPAETVKLNLPSHNPSCVNWLRAAKDAVGIFDSQVELAGGGGELGELFAIHRGQVTGMNGVWIANENTRKLIPERYLIRTITDAKEILNLPDAMLRNDKELLEVIDLPKDLSELADHEQRSIAEFLAFAEMQGAARTYIARHRRPWWRVGLKAAPALVMSYMARRPPRFALNLCQARLLNIAHGLYPKVALSQAQLSQIAFWLNSLGQTQFGRTYAGGLIKVEPGDACKIRIPKLEQLELAKAA